MRRRTDLTLKSGTLTTESRSLFAFRLTDSHVTVPRKKNQFLAFQKSPVQAEHHQNITDDVLPLDSHVLPRPDPMRLNQCNVETLTGTLG